MKPQAKPVDTDVIYSPGLYRTIDTFAESVTSNERKIQDSLEKKKVVLLISQINVLDFEVRVYRTPRYVEESGWILGTIDCFVDSYCLLDPIRNVKKKSCPPPVTSDLAKLPYKCFYKDLGSNLRSTVIDVRAELSQEEKRILDQSFLLYVTDEAGAPLVMRYWPWWVKIRFRLFINALSARADK